MIDVTEMPTRSDLRQPTPPVRLDALSREILALKKKLNAVILAHNYQAAEIQNRIRGQTSCVTASNHGNVIGGQTSCVVIGGQTSCVTQRAAAVLAEALAALEPNASSVPSLGSRHQTTVAPGALAEAVAVYQQAIEE